MLTPGRTVLRRYFRGSRLSFLNVAIVVADDERGLRLWIPAGAPYWRLVDAAGRTLHDASVHDLADARLTELTWSGDVLVFMPPGAAHSVWFFFADGEFTGWYGNLEAPYVRWDDGDAAGVDTVDHALDLLVAPDRTWRWKDEDEFASRTGVPDYWTAAGAAEIRAEGERLAKAAEAGAFPFDGTWRDFTPPAGWALPVRPAGWDRPRVAAR
jgi:hypothetical protein